MNWKIKNIGPDGHKSYVKESAGLRGRVWQYPTYYSWAVYRGSSELCNGKARSLFMAKRQASKAMSNLKVK